MKYFQNFLLLISALINTACAVSILLPLYIYPTPKGASPAAWQPVYDAITAYPSTTFYIVVNPNSGPECSGCAYPTDPNYVAAINTLNQYTNVFTLGYVRTNFTSRAYNAVVKDIATYAKWGYYTGANVSMAGIFFDEVSNAATAASYNYYSKASAYAYANVPSDNTPVVFNPGAPAPAKYFNYADFIVEYEQYYSNYTYPGTMKTFTSGYNSQAAIILHNTTLNANLSALVHPMVTSGVGAVYICPDAFYGDLTLLKNLTAAVSKG